MAWDFADYSGEDNTPSLPLLLSEQSQQLLLAAVKQMQSSYAWVDGDDPATYDIIHAQIAETITELIVTAMPDFSPVGTIVAFANYNSVPEKWLYCNGSLVAQSTYPELFDLIGTIYGATVGSDFRLPELRQRMIFGALNAPSYEQGVFAGVEATALSISNLPAHSHEVPAHAHTFSTSLNNGTRQDRVARGDNTNVLTQSTFNQPATNTDNVGAGASFNIMNPHLCVGYIIKALP